MRPNCLAIVVFVAALAITGCHKRVPVAALPPAAATPAPVASAPVASALDQADRAFSSGSYDEAARSYENYLRDTASGPLRDQAMFHLGLTYVLRPAPSSDWPRAAATFKQLADEYPNSPFKSPANLLLSLHSELDQASTDLKQRDQRIKQLTTELDRLKKIDADRRKKP